MVNSLDVIAVWVEHEGRIVPWMIGPLAGSTVVPPTSPSAAAWKRRTVSRSAV